MKNKSRSFAILLIQSAFGIIFIYYLTSSIIKNANDRREWDLKPDNDPWK